MPALPPSILVTGANGFVGVHAVAALRARHPDATIHTPSFELAEGASVLRAVETARPTVCLHLAAVSAIADAHGDPERAWAVNLGGTLALARALLRVAPGCRLLFAGSADAYGASFRSGAPLDEDAPLAPLNAYGATKAAADLALGAMASADGLSVIRFRPFNHTGPGQRDSFALGAFARQVAAIEAGLQPAVIRVGALDAERDFLDVRDVARAYADAATAPLASGIVLNLASGTPRRIGEVLDDLIRLAGVEVLVETDPARLRPVDIARAVGDASRARATLGWAPEWPWQRTLGDVLDDWRARIRAAGSALPSRQ